MPIGGNSSHLIRFLRRLAAGLPTSVVVIGGSMTAGSGCSQKAMTGHRCAWPARLEVWLRKAFPRSNLTFESHARGGCSLAFFIGEVSHYVKASTDMVVIDTLRNDWTFPWKQKGIGPSIALEAFIRLVHGIAPQAVIFNLFTGPSAARRELVPQLSKVSMFYNQPWLDFLTFNARRGDEFDNYKKWSAHPPWTTHQVIADVLANAWGVLWMYACSASTVNHTAEVYPAAGFAEQTFWPKSLVDEYEPCVQTLSRYAAHDNKTLTPTKISGDWALYEDRPGKPGWIASEQGATIRFRVGVGAVPRLMVTYLKSYESMGEATFTFRCSRVARGRLATENFSVGIDGHWGSRSSQAWTDMFWLRQTGCGGNQTLDFDVAVGGSRGRSHSSARHKFKLLSISSC